MNWQLLWMTLREAVSYVAGVHSSNEIEALDAIRAALGKGWITGRWGMGSFFDNDPCLSSEVVPANEFFWTYALIFLVENGVVIDQEFLPTKRDRSPQPRELFLLRSEVLALWPSAREEPAHVASSETAGPLKPRKRRPASLD